MTAEEKKAIELVSLFQSTGGNPTQMISNKQAKQCALIAVNEIIEAYPTFVETWHNSKGINVAHVDNREFWQEVKEEINKL